MPKTALRTRQRRRTPENRSRGDPAASDAASDCRARARGAVSAGRRRPGGAPVFSFRSGLDLSCCSWLRLDADRPRADRYRSASSSGQDYVAAPVGRACGQPAGRHVHHPGIRRDRRHGGLPLTLGDLPDPPPADRREGMGYGDFKMLAAIGAWIGWKLLPLVVLAAAAAHLVFVAIPMVSGRLERHAPVPFGPYLLLGAWIALLWGEIFTRITWANLPV